MDVKSLLCRTLREKPETMRASRKLGSLDFSRLVRMGLNEKLFGMSPKAVEAMQDIAEAGDDYQDWMHKAWKSADADQYGVTFDNLLTGS